MTCRLPPATRDLAAQLGQRIVPRHMVMGGLAVAIGMSIAFVLFVGTAQGVEGLAGGRLGGDWAAFWTGGVLARTDPQGLLDPEVQHRLMAPYLRDRFSPFAYPPVLAYLFVPATLVSFRLGYVVYVILLVIAALVAIRWLLDLFEVRSATWRLVGYLGGVTYMGTFRSASGAQNATLTLLVLVGGHRQLAKGHEWQAGMLFGLLWYKPQFAVPVLGLLGVGGYWRAALWGLVPGAALWIANALVFGADWVSAWADGILRVTDVGNRLVNTDATVSVVEYVRGRLGAPTGDVLGLALAAVIGAVFVTLAWRLGRSLWLLPLMCGALLVTAPHALNYELALLLPVFAAGLRLRGEDGVTAALGLYALGWVMLLPVHPLVRVGYVVVAIVWWLRALRRPTGDRFVHAEYGTTGSWPGVA